MMYTVLPKIARPMGGGFSPLSLSPVFWVSADTGVYQDAAGTTPAVADGDVVGLWKDLSGNGRDASQGTTANKPVRKSAIQNGRPAIRFNGVNNYLALNAVAPLFAVNTPIAVAVVCKNRVAVPGATDFAYLGMGRSTNANPVWDFTAETGVYSLFRRNDGGTSKQMLVGVADTAYHALILSFDGTNSALYVDGSQVGATTNMSLAGVMTLDRATLGALVRTTIINFLDGDLGEVIVFGAALADANRALVQAYLKSRWATP